MSDLARRPRLCLWCASSEEVAEEYKALACRLGRSLARRGWGLVYGGGAKGLMGAAATACLEEGGEVTGVIPRFMVENGWLREGLTRTVVTETMRERKHRMLSSSRAFIALPGGPGTWEELLEGLTSRQLGLMTAPVVILSWNDYYAPLLDLFRRAGEERFLRPGADKLYLLAHNEEEALDMVRESMERK